MNPSFIEGSGPLTTLDDLLEALRRLAQEMRDDGDSYVDHYGKRLQNVISRVR